MSNSSPSSAAGSADSSWQKSIDLPSERGASKLIDPKLQFKVLPESLCLEGLDEISANEVLRKYIARFAPPGYLSTVPKGLHAVPHATGHETVEAAVFR